MVMMMVTKLVMVMKLVIIMQKKADYSWINVDANENHLDHFGIAEVSEDQLSGSISWVSI